MIKKLNILLAVVFAAMLAMKGAKSLKAARLRRADAGADVVAEVDASPLTSTMVFSQATRLKIPYQTATECFSTWHAPFSPTPNLSS